MNDNNTSKSVIVDSITHNNEKRVDIPTLENAGMENPAVADQPKQGQYRNSVVNRGQDPELFWLNKYQNDDEETRAQYLKVDTRSLYIHEDIKPESIINRLYNLRRDEKQQLTLFNSQADTEDTLARSIEYYKHTADWQNRLIQGDSLLVMNSLLQREGMQGKVQCVYIDPPYGIKYGSNWQMRLNNRDVKDNDENLSGEPEMIKAFRDTWELGIHSYLSYLRDRLVCARELLTESGSCFVQISDENVHLVRSLMDEVFGSENFVSIITFKKASPLTSKGLACVADFIIWYAKDKENIKYRKLFENKPIGRDTGYTWVELKNGDRRKMTSQEKDNPSLLPKDSRVFFTADLASTGYTKSCMFDFEMNGVTYKCGKKSWKTNPEGMKKLISLNRIFAPAKNPCYVVYYEDYPVQPLNNLWDDTHGATDIQYVCQTSTKPIQRCILMTTDPGDLVLDPTCGSGTTAYVAEQWGRRWITIDTSRIALNIAKTRLTTAVFPYYELADKETHNIRQAFVYKKAPHITMGSITNDEPADEEILYDQPQEDKKKMRVSGPFTVETLQNFTPVGPESLEQENSADDNRQFIERVIAHLKASGVRNGIKQQQAIFTQIEETSNPYLHLKGWYTDQNGDERLAYLHIGPKFGTVSKRSVNMALQEFQSKNRREGASWLVILGFSFEDGINASDYDMSTFQVSKVRMADDLMQEGLLKKDKGAASFVIIGEPDIVLKDNNDGTVRVVIQGLDIYDPISDQVKARSVEDINYWEIDDDYDGQQFNVSSLHFCGGSKKEFAAWRKGLEGIASQKTKKNAEQTLRLTFNDDAWDSLYGFESEPIQKVAGRKIAVRVVSQFGEEASKVIEVG